MKHAKMKLLTALTEQSQHYKLYKSGRHWLLMGLTTATLGLAGGVTGANAATTTTATATTPQTTQTTTSATPVTTATTSTASSSAAPDSSSTAASSSAGATATPAPTTTNLGDATASDVAAAKSAAANTAATTGQAQQVTAVSATPASTANDTAAAAPADTTGAASTTPTATSAAATTPTTTDAADTTAELAALSDDVKQAMALSGVTYDKENLSADGSNYYFWGSYEYNGEVDYTTAALKQQVNSQNAAHVRQVVSATQVLSNNDQLLQKLAAQGITVGVLLQPTYSSEDALEMANRHNTYIPGYSGTAIAADYNTNDPDTQTITYINDSNQQTLATDTENSTVDATAAIQAELAQLQDYGYVEVSNNYQAPAATTTIDAAVATIQAKLEQALTTYNAANNTDYQLHLLITDPAGGTSEDQPRIDYRFLLTSEKLGHAAWDADIQQWITDWSTGYNLQSDGTTGIDQMYDGTLSLDDAIVATDDGDNWQYAAFPDNATTAVGYQIQTDTTALMATLQQDPDLATALETLRVNNRSFSIVGAPTYADTTLTYTTQIPIYDDDYQNITGYEAPVEHTLTVKSVSDAVLKQLLVGVGNTVVQTGTNTAYEVHVAEVRTGTPQATRTQIPDGASVSPDDYYDFTQPGQVADGIQVKTQVQVPAAVSVTPADYYDNTTPGQVDDGVLVKTKVQVPAAVSVTPADYYDNTTPGQVDDGVLVKTKVQVPAAVSVTPTDYYDHTAKTQVPDTDANGNDTPSTTPTTDQRDNTPVPATVPSTSQPATAVTATTTPTATVTPAHTAAQTTATPAATAQATTLPQTGATDETALLVLGGLTILGSIGLLGATKMHKRHDGSYDL